MKRVEEYRRPNGTWTRSKADAIRVTAEKVIEAVHIIGGTAIHDRYFTGTAHHESNFALNERDTEPSGFQSWGIYQVSRPEAASVGLPDAADLLDLLHCTFVMIKLAERHRRMLRSELKLAEGVPDPRDLAAYLAIAHNQGLHAAQKTIENRGLDWAAYKARNPTIRIVSSGYGDDVLEKLTQPRRNV